MGLKVVKGDLFSYSADLKLVPTNGSFKQLSPTRFRAVMGAGFARLAAERFVEMPFQLGAKLAESGNHVHSLGEYGDSAWLSFPTKDNPWEDSSIVLIQQSIRELAEIVKEITAKKGEPIIAAMPKPGCGCGNLSWGNVQVFVERSLASAGLGFDWLHIVDKR